MGVCVGLTSRKDTSIPLFLGQVWQRRRKERCFQVQLRPSRSQLISCSRQGLQHLLDTQSFPRPSRKAGCPESLLCSALAPSSLARPHTAQTKNQWPYKSQQHLQWWDVLKRLSSAVPGKQRESWGCWATTQIHLHGTVDLCSLSQYSQINSHMEIRFSPVFMTTHCTELLPRSAQSSGYYLTLFFTHYKNVQEKSDYALVTV